MPEPSPKEFQPYRKVQAQTEKDLRGILESTARAIQKRIASLPVGVGGQVRAAQLRTTLAAIKKLQRAMWTSGVSPTVQRAMDDAENAAESAIEAMTRVAYASLPDAAAEALVRGLRAAAESGLKSDAARRKRDLSERVYRQRAYHDGKVEDAIREGLIANLSAKELAETVYKYVSPTTPGGASYAAMRLARTEINNAFHERQLIGAKRPGVRAVKWNLSGSHRVPDLCNKYADHNGNGQYAPGSVPDKPHPQCFCYLTYVTMPAEEFRDKLAAGDFDDEIERRTRENLARLGQPVGDLAPPAEPERKLTLVKKTRRRDDPAYKKDYERGWKAAGRNSDIEKADKRGESDAFYDGFSDRSIGEPKWTMADEKDEKEAEFEASKKAKAIPVAKSGKSAHDVVPKGLFKRGSMTPKQRKELQTYESGWFVVINNFMRRNRKIQDDTDKRTLQTVQEIESAMDGSVLPEPIQVWRGMFNARSVFGDHFDNDLTGFSWDDLGFGSTTTNEDIVKLFNVEGKSASKLAGNVKMKVHVPAGVKALETSTWDKGSKANGPQAEITLQPGLTWKVVKDNGVNPDGVREIEVEVNPIG